MKNVEAQIDRRPDLYSMIARHTPCSRKAWISLEVFRVTYKYRCWCNLGL